MSQPKNFKHFRFDCIAACSLQNFDRWEDFDYSDGTFITQMYVLVSDGIIVTCFKRSYKYSLHPQRMTF